MEKRPDLSVEWRNVAELKIATRKETFHLGEIVNIDIAMLNLSNNQILFRSIDHPVMSVTNGSGRSIAVVPYAAYDLTFSSSLFELVADGDFLNHSFELLAGCDKRAFEQVNSSASSREQFANNLFLTWGSSCLQITEPGTYFISASFKNNLVLMSSIPGLKTAVGTLKSSPIKITVVE